MSKNKRTKIKITKLFDGEKLIRIDSIENVMHECEIPIEYRNSCHYTCPKNDKNRLLCVGLDDNKKRKILWDVYVGSTIRHDSFRRMIIFMVKCGNALHEIRQKEKKIRGDHYGQCEYII